MKNFFYFFSLFVGMSFLAGCFLPSFSPQMQSQRLPLPTKDEVAWVDGETLTISEVFSIRASLQTHSVQMAYWIGVASIVLQNSAHLKGSQLSYAAALEIARYALGDLSFLQASSSLEKYSNQWRNPPPMEDVRREIESSIKKADIKENVGILARLY